jgi:ankyrin repeat protein
MDVCGKLRAELTCPCTAEPVAQRGNTALMYASKMNKVEVVKLLLAAGADKDAVDKVSEQEETHVGKACHLL